MLARMKNHTRRPRAEYEALYQRKLKLAAAKRATAARGSSGGVSSAEEPSRAPPETPPPRIPMPPRQGRLDFGE